MEPNDSFIKDILQTAVDIELACAGVYKVFARQFSDNEELHTFWRLYAEAERYHAAAIRIHQETFGGAAPAEDDHFGEEARESRAFLEQLRSWIAQYELTKPSLNEAFVVAQEIETGTSELHGRTKFFAVYPDFEPIFRQIVEEDQDHRDLLVEAASRFGASG